MIAVTNTTASNNGYAGLFYSTGGNVTVGLVIDHVTTNNNAYGININYPGSGRTSLADLSRRKPRNADVAQAVVSGPASLLSPCAVRVLPQIKRLDDARVSSGVARELRHFAREDLGAFRMH